MPCKIDHTDPECIPQSLCHTCNPHFAEAHTPERIQAFVDAQRQKLKADGLRQELLRTEGKIASMSRDGEPDPCYVPVKARIYGSLQRKAARLKLELEDAA